MENAKDMKIFAQFLIKTGCIGKFIDLLYDLTDRNFMENIIKSARNRHPDPKPQPREGNFLYY